MTGCRQSRMLRLAALGLSHEANTFEPILVGPEAMVAAGVHRGGELRAEHAGANTTMAGFLAAEEFAGVEVVPLLHTADSAAGPISAVAFTSLADELLTALERNGPFDGVLAAVTRDAAVAEHCNDVDGYLLSRFRDIVGGEVPIGVALDLHANISAEMARNADIMATYRTNPHIDAKQRAEEVAALVIRAARGEITSTWRSSQCRRGRSLHPLPEHRGGAHAGCPRGPRIGPDRAGCADRQRRRRVPLRRCTRDGYEERRCRD